MAAWVTAAWVTAPRTPMATRVHRAWLSQAIIQRLHEGMDITFTGDTDADFVRGMIPHHQGAIDMAKTAIAFGKDPAVKKLAEMIAKRRRARSPSCRNRLKKNEQSIPFTARRRRCLLRRHARSTYLRQSVSEGYAEAVAGVMMDRDLLIHRWPRRFLPATVSWLLDGWTHLVLTSRLGDGSLDMNGFCYTAEGDAVPVSPRDFAIFDVLEELRAAMAKTDGKTPWVAASFASSARPASSPWNSNTSSRSARP